MLSFNKAMGEGVLENPAPAGIIGQHVYPLLPAGTVGFRPGMMMASCDEIDIRITGKGGHGAVPQHAVDPIAIAAQMVTALQQVVSRMADPRRSMRALASTSSSCDIFLSPANPLSV